MSHPFVDYVARLAPTFCALGFEIATLGRARQEAVKAARQEIVPHQGLPCDRIEAQYSQTRFAPQFLMSIVFHWDQPQSIRLADLEGAFGPHRVLYGVDGAPPTFQFVFRRFPLVGHLGLTVRPRPRTDILEVTRASLQRCPPEPYPFERGRQVRLVVLADLGETAAAWPMDDSASVLWSGIDDALASIRPCLHLQVANHLGGPEKTWPLSFQPAQAVDFKLDRLLRFLRPVNALVQARHELAAFAENRIDRDRLAKSVDLEAIPASWAERISRAASGPLPPGMMEELDKALSAQCEILLADEKYKLFAGNWLGLQMLAEQLKAEDESYVEVYACSRAAREDLFHSRLLEEELYHRTGSPPVLVVLGDLVQADASEIAHLRTLASVAAKMETLIAFGIKPGHEGVGAWRELQQDPLGRYLVPCVPQVCFHPDIVTPGVAPKRFGYVRGPSRLDTTIYASAVWAFAALCAASHAKLGRIEPQSVSIPLPPLLRDAPDTVPVLEPLPASAAGGSFTVLKYNKDEKTISLAKLSALNESSKPEQKLAARLIFNPLVQTIHRLRYLHAADTNPRAIVDPLRKALQARLPDSMVDVDVKGGKLQVQVIPAFEVAGKLTPFKYDQPWPEPRSS